MLKGIGGWIIRENIQHKSVHGKKNFYLERRSSSGSTVNYATGEYIELQIGFGVLLGADFSATINPFGGANPLQEDG